MLPARQPYKNYPILFLLSEVCSGSRPPPSNSQPPRQGPPDPNLGLNDVDFPDDGLLSTLPNGEFYQLVPHFTPISEYGWYVGILDRDGFFRGIYDRDRQMVKIKRRPNGSFRIVRMPPAEIASLPLNRNIAHQYPVAERIVASRRNQPGRH